MEMTVKGQQRSEIAQVIQATSSLVEPSQAKLKIGTDCSDRALNLQPICRNMTFDLVTWNNLKKFFILPPGIDALQQSIEHAILKPNYLGPLLSQPTTTNKPTTQFEFANICSQTKGEVQHRQNWIHYLLCHLYRRNYRS